MTEHRGLCSECLGVHPDGDCLVTEVYERGVQGDGADAKWSPCMPSRKTMEAAATTMARLREQKERRLEQLETDLEETREKVREIAAARAELRKDLRVLAQALEVIQAAARATLSEKVARGRGRRDLGTN